MMDLHKVHSVDCPTCGCNSTALIGAGGTIPRVWARFQCGFCGKLFTVGSDPTEERVTNGVVYQTTNCRCPKCKAKNPPVRSTQGRIRYHQCQNCGQNFKSVEAAE